MKQCENCGAYLDAGERCDCEQSMQDVLTEPGTKYLTNDVKRLPRDAQIRILGIIEGAKIASERAG